MRGREREKKKHLSIAVFYSRNYVLENDVLFMLLNSLPKIFNSQLCVASHFPFVQQMLEEIFSKPHFSGHAVAFQRISSIARPKHDLVSLRLPKIEIAADQFSVLSKSKEEKKINRFYLFELTHYI